MKLRIKGNSIRLRLGRKDITSLQETGQVREKLELGPAAGGDFQYSLRTTHADEVEVRHRDGELSIDVPHAWLEVLVNTEQVGFEREVVATSGSTVLVIVEKDFTCLVVRPGEDESDFFLNPAAGNDADA